MLIFKVFKANDTYRLSCYSIHTIPCKFILGGFSNLQLVITTPPKRYTLPQGFHLQPC